MRGLLVPVVAVALVAATGGAPLAQEFSVRVTVTLANVRTGPSTSTDVVTQVPGGTVLPLRRVEGDWFRVELTDPSNGRRIEAYLSKTVAVVEAPPATARPTPGPEAPAADAAPAPSPEPPPPPSAESLIPRRDGISVALQIGVSTAWLTPEPTTVGATGTDIAGPGAVTALPPELPVPPPPNGGDLTWVWTVPGGAARQIVSDRRPSFVAVFKDVPGVRPEDIEPHLVRLTPVDGRSRAVATIRSRGDRATDREMSWNVTHDLKQNVQRVTRETIERGAVRIQPAADLPPGEYAIVLRPRDGWRLAGASVLSAAGEGRLFHWIWDFSIRE